MSARITFCLVLLCLHCGRAAGFNWPTNQWLPTFSTPVPILDCIDVSSASSAEINLFASLEGIVNRSQPQIACVSSSSGEGEFTWLNLHNLAYNVTNGYGCLIKYKSYLSGLVVTDPSQPDTLNLATTMAGVNNELICDPSLLATLTNAPYSFSVVDDLRGRFANEYQVYGYLYTNYWPQCTHRVMAGLNTNLTGNLRDYLVAVKCATVWLDPGSAQDAAALAPFLAGMTPAGGVYIGWWPSEANGLTWIANYGIPVLASDFYCNGSVFSGVARPINLPAIPPPPPLQNKVYVALVLSDGDNAQYMQHVMKMDWESSARGSVPIGWTADPLVSLLDPAMMAYYWSTASSNDCLVAGPSGAGYAHLELWSAANLTAYASASDGYLQRSGLRTVSIWDQVTSGIAQAYATNCPTVLGLLDQSGNYNAVNLGLRTIGLTPTYASTTNAVISAITSAANSWNGTAPLFLVAQEDTWNLGPADLLHISQAFNTNEYQFVRADHLFLLAQQAFGAPTALTQPPASIGAGQAVLQGTVAGNAANTLGWLEWGTNLSYGAQCAVTNLGNASGTVSTTVTGLLAHQIYHYRVAASNVMGMAWGADKQFTTGGRLEVWGGSQYGATNVPAGLTNIIRIACGATHALGLKNDGTVVAWGGNTFGQTNVPVGLTNVVDVAAGIQHSLALLANGTVVAWGGNAYGQTNVPAGLTNIVAIAAGGYHNLALAAQHAVTAWGYNAYGQTNVPAGLSNVVGVAAGYGHSLALQAGGTVVAWGWNTFGQTNVPASLSNVVAVAAGEYHSMALRANGAALANLAPAARWVADQLTGASGSAVGNWTDVIGGKAATQSAAASQPRLYTQVLNGHSTVRFSSAASQYLTVSSAANPLSGVGDFTIVMVFQTATPGNAAAAFYQNTGLLGADVSGVTADWSFVLNGSELGAGLGAGSTGCNTDFSLYGGSVTDGQPHIGAYVRSGNVIRLYVDGAIVAEQTSLCTGARIACPFEIGAMTTAPEFFNGDIAEIEMYHQALNAWEMAGLSRTLANTYGLSGVAGALVNRWVADSLTGNNGSPVASWLDRVGGKYAVQSATGNQPLLYTNSLNGHNVVRFSSAASQHLTVAAADSPISGAGSFTLAVVFRTSTPGNNSSSFFLNTGLLGAEQPNIVDDWAFCLNGNQLCAGLGAGTGCNADFSCYGGLVTDGNPHIGLYVRNGDTVSLYVDGAVVASQNALCADARLDCAFQIGAMTASSYFYNGDLAEIQLYNRALSPLEIAYLNEGLAGTYGVGGLAGTVVAWGNNTSGQATVPASLTTVAAIASGNDSAFNLALQTGGTVTGWGNDSQNQTNVPASLTNVAAIALGSSFGLAIGNQAPVAANATFSGYVNHDLALTLPATSPDGNVLNYYLQSLPAAGTLYQDVAGARGLPITASNAVVSNPGGQVIFAPPASASGTPFASFFFQVNDGVYGSGSAQVTVNIGLPAAPQAASAVWLASTNGGAALALNFSGSSNATYSVWASTNLSNWTHLGPATEIVPGGYGFSDLTTTQLLQRFYRLSAP